MKLAIVLTLLATLGSCNAPDPRVVIVEKHTVPAIPDEWFKCLSVNYPDYKTLTDRQLAKLITALNSANVKCQANMDKIKRLIDKAREAVAAE